MRHPRVSPRIRLLPGCGVALSLLLAGCDSSSEGDGSAGVATESAGATDAPGDDGGMDADGPPETEGEMPPEIQCGDGVHTGPILINPGDPNGVPVETLDGISIIDGDLLISSTSYTDLSFLKCLRAVRGDIQIYGNPFLESLTGTDTLEKVGRYPAPNPTPNDPNAIDEGKGSITISENPALVDIDGFNGLTEIGQRDPENSANESSQSLVVRNNDTLATFSGFSNLQIIFESLVIQQNPVLKDIDGLRALQVIDGFFSVTRNASLCSSSVTAVGQGLVYLGDPEHSTDAQNDDSC